MAYRVSQYQEVLTTSSVQYSAVVGVQVPFQGTLPSSSLNGSDAVFNVNYTSKDQIKSNIVNFLLTDQGERYFNTQFGSNLRRYLFSTITEESIDANMGIADLQINIKNELSANFPMVKFNSVNIISSPDNNQISISISYSFAPNVNDYINITI